jgi:BirA family transcriptional regulator, biotin operon repressor / biotin---[acetyl-CoA-carboxylase] ligase
MKGGGIGRYVHYLDDVDSTNALAFKLAMKGVPDGTVVVADRQTKGRGRLNRTWESPPNCNVYTSVILRPHIEIARAPLITLMAGAAVAEVIDACCPGQVTLKWPNDVQVGGKKVCGILTEMRSTASGIDCVIVGIGVNVNMSMSDISEDVRGTATSLKEASGRRFSRLDILTGLLTVFERMYGVFLAEGFAPIRAQWLKYFDMMGKEIRITFKDEIQTGKVAGIDDGGALLIVDAGGTLRRIFAGDASVLKE